MTGPSRRAFLTTVWGTGAATVSSRSWVGLADRVVTTTDLVLTGDRVRTLRAAADGGFLVGGDVGASVWFQKLRADGTTVWQRTFGSEIEADPNLHAIAGAPGDGYALVAGDRDRWTGGGADAYVVRTDGRGRKRWRATVTVPDRDPSAAVELASGVEVAPDGDVLAAGGVRAGRQSAPASARPWVARFAPDGTARWTRTYDVDGVRAGRTTPAVRELSATGDGARALLTVGTAGGTGLAALALGADGDRREVATFEPAGDVVSAEPHGDGYVVAVTRDGGRPDELVVVDRSLAPRRRLEVPTAGTLAGVTPLDGGGFLTSATRGAGATVLARLASDGSATWTHAVDGPGTVVAASDGRYATAVSGDRLVVVEERGARTLDALLALGGGAAALTAGAATLEGGDDD